MTPIDEVGKTAFIVACWRAQEAQRKNPIFTDPHARLFVNEEMSGVANDLSQVLPGGPAMVRYRTRFFNDSLAKQIASGKRQVIILGAGFDTRSLTSESKNVRFFEIDKSAVLDFKHKVLKDAGIVSNSVYTPCDYVKDDFISVLESHGFDSVLPTYIIWEGNTAYLSKEQIAITFGKIKHSLRHFAISLDYLSEEIVTQTTGIQALTDAVACFAAMGSPWITGFSNAGDLADALELNVVEDRLTSDLAKTYSGADQQHAAILSNYAVCTLDSQLPN